MSVLPGAKGKAKALDSVRAIPLDIETFLTLPQSGSDDDIPLSVSLSSKWKIKKEAEASVTVRVLVLDIAPSLTRFRLLLITIYLLRTLSNQDQAMRRKADRPIGKRCLQIM